MKNYDVIIVNYNGEKIIRDCLDSIYNSIVRPVKIIIYDNASRDNSINLIRQHYPEVILISGKTNLGFGRANNEAMKRSKSEFILFMNNDVILDKKCSCELLKGLDEPNIAISNPLIFRGWEKKEDALIYSFGAEMNKSGFGYGLFDKDDDRTDLNCFSGACFMTRGQIIKKMKFEKNFFLYYEEPELSVKILMQNYKIGRSKKAKCYHLESYSSPNKKNDGISFRQFYAIQNRWYMLGKYWPSTLLISAIPLNFFHLTYNVFFFIRNGKYNYTKIIFLAFASLYKGRKLYNRGFHNNWTKKLTNTKISSAFNISKRVYR